jgi:hypothetical protein
MAGITSMSNEAQQRLIYDPLAPDEGFEGSEWEIAFNVTPSTPFITPPWDVARVVAMTVCQGPVQIRNRLFEYMPYHSGRRPLGCTNSTSSYGQTLEAYERANVITMADFVSGSAIRLYTTNDNDANSKVLIQGKDINGSTVYSEDPNTGQAIQGEYVVLATPFVDTLYRYSELTGIQKDITWGDVQFFMVDAAGTETALTVMQPGEDTTLLRRYYINGLPRSCCNASTIQVKAMCRMDFVQARSDADYLYIQNIPALIEEVQAIRYGRMDLPAAQTIASSHHAMALRLLFGQMDHLHGKNTTSIGRSLFGSNALRNQPV